MKHVIAIVFCVLFALESNSQYLDIGYPYGLGDADGNYRIGIGYVRFPRFFGYELKVNYASSKLEEEEFGNFYGTVGLTIMNRPLNTMYPTYKWLTLRAGYGGITEQSMTELKGMVLGAAYTLQVHIWEMPTLSISAAYDHFFIQSRSEPAETELCFTQSRDPLFLKESVIRIFSSDSPSYSSTIFSCS